MAAQDGFGTILKMSTDDVTYLTIGSTQDIQVGTTLDEHDVTAHDSPGQNEEIIPGIRRADSIGVDFWHDPAEASHKDAAGSVIDVHKNRTKAYFKVVLPTAGAPEITFRGYVVGHTLAFPVNGPMKGTVTVKPTGGITHPA